MTDRIKIEKARHSSAPKKIFAERLFGNAHARMFTCLFLAFVFVCLVMLYFASLPYGSMRTYSTNNQRNIGIAAYSHHEDHGKLPFTRIGDPEFGQHSWAYQLLPYLDESELYNEVQTGEPWDSPKNRTAYQTPVAIFERPHLDRDLNIGGYAPIVFAANQRLFYKDSPLSFKTIPDDVSNTIMFGEVSNGIKAWGDPSNTRDPTNGIGDMPTQFKSPDYGGRFTSTMFIMLDGSARSIDNDIDPSVMRALATPDGGEVVGEF